MGGVGAVLGGPIGAGIGIALGGTLFDSPEQPEGMTEEESGIAYFVCFFASLAKIAKADGRVTQEEIQAVQEILQEMELDQDAKDFAIKIFREAKDNEVSAAEYLSQFAELIQYDAEIGASFLAHLCTIASADGDVSEKERFILKEAERILRLQPETINMYLGNGMSLEQAYALLSCDTNMNDSDIKLAYRKKCMDFHPDKLASKGLPQEFIRFANDQTTNLNEAYEVISNFRNRKRETQEMCGITALERLKRETLYAFEDATQVYFTENTMRVIEENNQYCLELYFPGIAKEDIKLTSDRDGLNITIGGHHRNLVLPVTLSLLQPARATKKDDYLKIYFA
ncbi:MAG: TerB family tellurite resistance protein [Pseudanabaena sp.]